MIRSVVPKKLDYARITASWHGGFAVTEGFEILRRGEMESTLKAVIFPVKNKASTESGLAWNEALKGNLYTAMKTQAMMNETELSRKMFDAGALTVSLSPGSIIGLTRGSPKKLEGIKKSVKSIITNEPTTLDIKSKRVYKTSDFLKLDGAENYRWL